MLYWTSRTMSTRCGLSTKSWGTTGEASGVVLDDEDMVVQASGRDEMGRGGPSLAWSGRGPVVGGTSVVVGEM